MLFDVHKERIVQTGIAQNDPLAINVYDSNFGLVETAEVELLQPPLRAYWAQGLIQIGDYFVLAHMGKDDAWMGSDKGDVFVSILDRDWMLVEQQRVTFLEDGEGAMRPWVARKGDQMLVSFDLYTEQTIVEMRLDLSQFGLDGSEPDTGVDPGGTWVAASPDSDAAECGCKSSEATLVLPWCILWGIRRRSS